MRIEVFQSIYYSLLELEIDLASKGGLFLYAEFCMFLGGFESVLFFLFIPAVSFPISIECRFGYIESGGDFIQAPSLEYVGFAVGLDSFSRQSNSHIKV